MPSVLAGNVSGGQNLLSGWLPWSGHMTPIGGAQLLWAPYSSGNCYVSLSGGTTINSGAQITSGGSNSGLLDGMLMAPGTGYFIPKIGIGPSGNPQIFFLCDQSASGQGRLFFELY